MITVRSLAVFNTLNSLLIMMTVVLTAEYASLIAMEFGRNPVVNDEAAFDIYSP